MLALKYFVIIKKGEIVASRIDFDEHKTFERGTNDLCLRRCFKSLFQEIQEILNWKKCLKWAKIANSLDWRWSWSFSEASKSFKMISNLLETISDFFESLKMKKSHFGQKGATFRSTLFEKAVNTFFWLGTQKRTMPGSSPIKRGNP